MFLEVKGMEELEEIKNRVRSRALATNAAPVREFLGGSRIGLFLVQISTYFNRALNRSKMPMKVAQL